ncbi:ead/Ea22-like family protein [Leucobacter sp. cx-169]|uniref:ead/Ea22-like family protein n=1 Tax=Leucobacter sp. cx-169 TaxID=2770549 RepID=UPI00165D9937|nr:ead/Ea22-like family protein [Leucobacter sp. cx-169]MBC9927195.1 ead/Ea22-like family protein [Leucobacter sp. cx-169]
MSEINAAELRAKAEVATPGPWIVQGHEIVSRADVPSTSLQWPWVADVDGPFEDAAFIAAANPLVVIALLDDRDRLAGDLRTARRQRDEESEAKSGNIRALNRALTERDAALGHVEAALELHQPCLGCAVAHCFECGTDYPCRTAKALGLTPEQKGARDEPAS